MTMEISIERMIAIMIATGLLSLAYGYIKAWLKERKTRRRIDL